MSTRIHLVARTLDRIEMMMLDQTVRPEFRGATWLEVSCGKCAHNFQINARTLQKIVERDGYIYCANGMCAERLYAMSQEDADLLLAKRERENARDN